MHNLKKQRLQKKQPKERYFYAKSSFMLADRDSLMRVDLTVATREKFFPVATAIRKVAAKHRDKAITDSIQIDYVIEISKDDYLAINCLRNF